MKRALFIGGTKGLGLALATLAAENDYLVMVAGRSASSCELTKKENVHPIFLDLETISDLQILKIPTADLIVWSAGIYQEGAFINLKWTDIDKYCKNHLQGPVCAIQKLLAYNRANQQPCHLVVIGSSSVYTSRVDESLYDALKAAKAHLARALGKELPRDIPGSKVLLANPGGMATPFWDGRGRDISKFMKPEDVAAVIWREILNQKDPFKEIRIVRQPDRSAKLEPGPIIQS